MSIIDLCYATFHLATQTAAPTLPGFQVIKRCVQYLASHPHKPIFYPSNYYDGSNVIRLIWSRNQVEEYTTQNFWNAIKMLITLEFSKEYGQFQVLYILYLAFLTSGKYRFDQL